MYPCVLVDARDWELKQDPWENQQTITFSDRILSGPNYSKKKGGGGL